MMQLKSTNVASTVAMSCFMGSFESRRIALQKQQLAEPRKFVWEAKIWLEFAKTTIETGWKNLTA